MSFTPQTSVATAPPIALAGMIADSGFTDKISRRLTVATLPGLVVCGDEDTAEPPDSAADVVNLCLGGVIRDHMVEPASSGFAVGSSVSVMSDGRMWMSTLSGAAPTAGAAVYVYRGATAGDRGKVTQSASAGVTRAAGLKFTGRTTTGLAEVEFNSANASSVELEASIPLPLRSFREVSSAGDVGAIAAIGGNLASDTTPVLRADANESEEVFWAAGNTDIISVDVPLPKDFDDAYDGTVDLFVASGATDAASFTLMSSWNKGAQVADSFDDSTTKSATFHVITATIATADIPAGAITVTLQLVPPAHATDGILLGAARLNYRRKPATG